MKFQIVVTLLLATLLCSAANASTEMISRLSLVSGDVQIRDNETDEWYPAAINTPLAEGDSIWCPQGARAEIQLRNGSYIRLNSRSSLDITELSEDYQQFHLSEGRLYARTGRESSTLQVDLGDASITINSKSRLDAELVGEDEEVSIYSGSAYVESAGIRTRVRAGETMTVHDESSEISPLQPSDEWRQWNTQRDRKVYGGKPKGRYLPEELVIYEDELSRNGEWVVVEEYGTVWRPTVITEPDWAPYRVGRWVWRASEYVWISYEPWGWAPHHYGRWISHPARGWCWVPPSRGDVYWAPGYVAWASTPAYVGWAPLAPGETYYGRGFYGSLSVNITSGHSHNDDITRYRNVKTRNAVTVISQNDFYSGKTKPRAADENQFRNSRDHTFGPPGIKPPLREARMPQVRYIKPAQLPPSGKPHQSVHSIKERYPRIKDSRHGKAHYREKSDTVVKEQQRGKESAAGKPLHQERIDPKPTPVSTPGSQQLPAARQQAQPPAKGHEDRKEQINRPEAGTPQNLPDSNQKEMTGEKRGDSQRRSARQPQKIWRIEQKEESPKPAKPPARGQKPKEKDNPKEKEKDKERQKESRPER